MSGKQAKRLKSLVFEQFRGMTTPAVVRRMYRRTKKAYNSTPSNQKRELLNMLENSNKLRRVTST